MHIGNTFKREIIEAQDIYACKINSFNCVKLVLKIHIHICLHGHSFMSPPSDQIKIIFYSKRLYSQ